MPATTGTTAAMMREDRAIVVATDRRRRETRRSRNSPRVASAGRRCRTHSWHGRMLRRGCAESAARPCTWASAAAADTSEAPRRTGGTVRAPRAARRLDRLHGPLEQRLQPRDQILVEEGDRVVAGVALPPTNQVVASMDNPRRPAAGARAVVGHLREGPGVRPAASAPARTAVVADS